MTGHYLSPGVGGDGGGGGGGGGVEDLGLNTVKFNRFPL